MKTPRSVLTLILAYTSVTALAGWDTSFSSAFPPDKSCASILATADTVYVGTDDGSLLKWTPGAGWSYLTPNLVNGPIRFIGIYAGQFFIGGDFSTGYNGGDWVTLNNVAQVNLSNGQFIALGNGVVGVLRTMVVAPDDSKYRGDFLYVGGYLSQAGGQPIAHIAAWNGWDWYNLEGGLPSSHWYTTDGVHSMVVDRFSRKHELIVVGRFDVGPNVSKFVESSDGGTWTPVGTGFQICGYDPYDNCVFKVYQGRATYAHNAVKLGTNVYMQTFETSWVNGYFILDPCPECTCGAAARGFDFAKLGIRNPTTLTVWTWQSGPAISSIWSDGNQMYAYADFPPYQTVAPFDTVALYSSGVWVDLTGGGLEGLGICEGPNSMGKSTLGLFLATSVPRRWQ